PPNSREPCRRNLEQLTSLLKAGDVMWLVSEKQGHRLDYAVGRQVGHERATSDEDLDQPFFRERLDRLANRRAAHAKPFGKIALGRNLVTRLEGARENLLLDLVDDFLVEPLLRLDWQVHRHLFPSSSQRRVRSGPERRR